MSQKKVEHFFLRHMHLTLKIKGVGGGKNKGSMPEWLMGADCKSAGYAYVGSNPTRPNLF